MNVSPHRHVFLAVSSMLLGTLLLGGSCDQTKLSGTVHPSPVSARVGEKVTLTLQVPADIDECVHREMWEVEPRSLGEVVHADDSARKRRRVTFVGKAPGTGQIRVDGFCRQTNPQPITRVGVRVEE